MRKPRTFEQRLRMNHHLVPTPRSFPGPSHYCNMFSEYENETIIESRMDYGNSCVSWYF